MKQLVLKRILSCLLAACLVLSLAPSASMAEGEAEDTPTDNTPSPEIDVTFMPEHPTVQAGKEITLRASYKWIDSTRKDNLEFQEWFSQNPDVLPDPEKSSDFQRPKASNKGGSVKATVTASASVKTRTVVPVTLNINGEFFHCDVTVEPLNVERVEIKQAGSSSTASPVLVLTKGNLKLEATAYDDQGPIPNAPIEWTSDPVNIATVQRNGMVVANNSPGKASIYASCNGIQSKAFEIIVREPLKLTLSSPPSLQINGDPGTLTATVTPSDYTNETITWTVQPDDIVKLSDDQTKSGESITVKPGSKKGTVTITAKVTDQETFHSNGSASASCNVSVSTPDLPVKSITINNKDSIPTLVFGTDKSYTLSAVLTLNNGQTVNPADAGGVEWSSSDLSVAQILSDGKLIPRSGGQVTITVRSKRDPAVTDTCTIHITEELKYITIAPSRVNLQVNANKPELGTETITVQFYKSSATPKPKITFTQDPNSNGIIKLEPNADGLTAKITALKAGHATITATAKYADADGGNAAHAAIQPVTCEVYVTEPVIGLKLPEKITAKKGDTSASNPDLDLYSRCELTPKSDPKTAGVTWSSSDNRVVYVDKLSGALEVRGYSEDPITITAKVGNVQAECMIELQKTSVTSVELTGGFTKDETGKKVASVSLGSYLMLSATVKPATATDLGLVWTSSDPETASVNSKTGRVTPRKITAASKPVIITVASAENNEIVDTVELTVIGEPVGGIHITPAEPITLNIGDQRTISATLTPPGADAKFIWNTIHNAYDDGIIRLGTKDEDLNDIENLIIEGKSPGESGVTVTAAGTGYSDTVRVTVSGIAFEQTGISMAVGKTQTITKKLYGSAKTLDALDWEWSSDNEAVARVNASSGTVTAVKAGTATISCKNQNYKASLTVTVSEETAETLSASMTAKTLTLKSFASQVRTRCNEKLKSPLDYVSNLSVSPDQGTLFYGYVSPTAPGEGVAATEKFYWSVPSTTSPNKLLERVTFVPTAGYTGDAVIDYTAYSENGTSYAGSFHVSVYATKEIEYSSSAGEAIHFNTSDFNVDSQRRKGFAIDSVSFTPPSERYGYLYYEYAGGDIYGSNITSNRRFFATSTPALNGVSFVPRPGYTGSFTLSYTGRDTGGNNYTGTIRISVKNNSNSEDELDGDLSYSTTAGHRVYFDLSDFQAYCKNITGGKLYYVRFTDLPDSSDATLYRGSGNSRVSTTTKCYASGSSSNKLSEVNLRPDSDYTGTISLPFEGIDRDDETFSGTVTVRVTQDGDSAGTIYMSTNSLPLAFRRADFAEACQDALPGTLTSVCFDLPSSTSGTLYSSFRSPNDCKLLRADQDIPAASLVELTYLPCGDYSGNVYLSYTALDEKGNSCNGQVRVTVTPDIYPKYFTDLNSAYAWAIPSIDFLRSYGIVNGVGDQTFRPAQALKRGDFVLMLCRAFALDLVGSQSFPDVPQDRYYAGAIAAAKAQGLVQGSGENGTFRPEATITRQEAATILYRALQKKGRIQACSTSELAGYNDQSQVESYAREALASLIRDGIFAGSNNNLYPTSALTRAQMAVILHRAIT